MVYKTFLNKKAGFFIFSMLCLIPVFVNAEVLFSDNFNSHPDWHNSCERSSGTDVCGCVDTSCIDRELPNWEFWNMDEMWNPDIDGDSSRPQISISSENARSGKCLTMSPESHRGRGGDGWGSDGVISTTFPDVKEVWVELWMKRQSDFNWHDEGERASGIKIVRIESDDGTRPFSFSFSENAVPTYIYKYGHKQLYHINDAHDHSIRCSESDPYYFCSNHCVDLGRGEGYPIDTGDGSYYRYTWHLVMNSSVGVYDGVFEHFVEGSLVRSKYDIAWEMSSDGTEKYFNFLGLGGNNFNGSFDSFPPAKKENVTGDETEGWYAIDDVCVATTEEDLKNCTTAFGSLVIRSDVDQDGQINTIDSMLTLRNSLGLDMSGTAWQLSNTTGDVNCDGDSSSTDAMLLLRYSLGLDMSETDWCE